MPRYSPRLNQFEFLAFIKKKIDDAGIDISDYERYGNDKYFEAIFDEDVEHPLINTIWNDWKKINFSLENHDCIVRPNSLFGLQELPNGFSFVGYLLGGDWEAPLFGIVYSDGTKLRGYIPTDGNIFDKVNKRAWGNNDDDEDEAANHNRDPYEWEAIKQDIMQRIHIR